MLENGFGEHNIQGIGDKHIPLIHNVMNTDVVVRDQRRATDELDVLFNTDAGRGLPRRPQGRRRATSSTRSRTSGFSSICNVLAAIKTAKLLGLGPDDAIITVATDGGAMYPSERAKTIARALRRRRSATSTPPRCSASISPTSTTDAHDRLHRARPQPDLQPRLLHVGRAAGHAVRAVRGPPVAGVLARAAPLPRRCGTR